jgi:hypothetical protein
MAKRKVPSQAASGADTFSDSLVGRQITDGSSQLTNTNFTIDRSVPEKDTKKFKTSTFSNFFSLDDLNEETLIETTQIKSKKGTDIKFKSSKNDAGVSLFGSLKSRLSSSVTKIINKFPAAVLIDKDSSRRSKPNNIFNITYSANEDITKFDFDSLTLYNPLDVVFIRPKSADEPENDNSVRKFYSSYTKYVVEISGVTNQFQQLK